MVAPFAGAWIETTAHELSRLDEEVAPFAGAWIETDTKGYGYSSNQVAPFAGAWIETTYITKYLTKDLWSLPLRERGLKHQKLNGKAKGNLVAPFAGAWIETGIHMVGQMRYRSLPLRERGLKLAVDQAQELLLSGRSLCGSVD